MEPASEHWQGWLLGLITTTLALLPLLIKHGFTCSSNICLLQALCTHQWSYRLPGIKELQNRKHYGTRKHHYSVVRAELFKQKKKHVTLRQTAAGGENVLSDRQIRETDIEKGFVEKPTSKDEKLAC